MNILLNIKLVFFLQMCYINENVGSDYFEQLYDDSQSQENNFNMKHQQIYQNFYQSINQNGNNDYDEYECNNCACNKCENPPECCRKVCENCPGYIPRFQYLEVPQITAISATSSPMQIPLQQWQQLPIQMPMSSLPMNMPQMPMQNFPMQMPISSFTFPGQQPNQRLVLFPFPSNFINPLLNNMTRAEDTTTQTTTTTITTQSGSENITIELNNTEIGREFNLTNALNNNNRILESLIRKALSDYSIAMNKIPKKTKVYNQTSRRTKPTWISKFGLVPVPDNFATKILSHLRNIKKGGRMRKNTIILTT